MPMSKLESLQRLFGPNVELVDINDIDENIMSGPLRQSGRSTRMLQKAIEYARSGLDVYVIAYGYEHMRALIRLLIGMTPDERWCMRIRIVPYYMISFDWDTMTFPGRPEGSMVLIDHLTIEMKMAKMGDKQ